MFLTQEKIITPPGVTIDFFVYFFVYLFLSLFLSQEDYEKTAGPICMNF